MPGVGNATKLPCPTFSAGILYLQDPPATCHGLGRFQKAGRPRLGVGDDDERQCCSVAAPRDVLGHGTAERASPSARRPGGDAPADQIRDALGERRRSSPPQEVREIHHGGKGNTETLGRLLKEKTPSYGCCGGIHELLEETTARPVLIHRPRADRTWVWSDLHLGDTEVMEYCRRPFGDADAMGRAIMAAWAAAVDSDDTILNGGDITLSSALGKTRRTAIQEAPGRKLLVVGNHDVNLRSGLLDTAGHDTWTGFLVIETHSPIVMTHVPMDFMPPGWVNVHGHVQQSRAPRRHGAHQRVRRTHGLPAPTAGSLVTLAKHLLAGDVPGATTDDRVRNAEGANGQAIRCGSK